MRLREASLVRVLVEGRAGKLEPAWLSLRGVIRVVMDRLIGLVLLLVVGTW